MPEPSIAAETMFRAFHHIGLPTEDPQADETYVEETKVWVTDPADHPCRVEFLRYEEDSPVTGPLREKPHVAYRVEELKTALEGKELLLEPFIPMPGLSVAFFEEDGVVIEYMQFEGERDGVRRPEMRSGQVAESGEQALQRDLLLSGK